MGFSTVTCRVRDAAGVESDHQFTVPNELSNGTVTAEEARMAVEEVLRQGLPEGTTVVGDSFVLREGNSDRFRVTQLFAKDAVVPLTGMARLFTPREPARVVTLAPVNITAEAPRKGTVIDVNDLPDVEPSNSPSVVKFEDLPLAGTVINVNDLPDA
jgi:hypothetical protein